MRLLRILYSIAIEAYTLLLRIASFFHPKAQKIVQGRAQTLSIIKSNMALHNHTPLYWFHCASLGEFEQALPVIEQLQKNIANARIAVSFFSPSGYEHASKYPQINMAFYLPQDRPGRMQELFETLKPKALIVVKYELWYYLIQTAKAKRVPVIWLSAKLHKKGVMLPAIRSFYLNIIAHFDLVFAQDSLTYNILKPHVKSSSLFQISDTRINRVQHLAQTPFTDRILEDFTSHYPQICMLGSSWKPEEDLILNALQSREWGHFAVAIAPHNINRAQDILLRFADFNPLLYSEYNNASEKQKKDCKVLVINTVGKLSKLYRYAFCAWVGGGFSNALHNIFEPAVYGIPVFWGPYTPKFSETSLLINAGVGFSVANANEFINTLSRIDTNQTRENSVSFFNDSSGNIIAITQHIQKITS